MVHVVYTLFWTTKGFNNVPGVPLIDSRDPEVVFIDVGIWVRGCWRGDEHSGTEGEEGRAGVPEVGRVGLNILGLVTVVC